MRFFSKISAVFLIACIALSTRAQVLSNWRLKTMVLDRDTIVLDTLSIVPLSLKLQTTNGEAVDTTNYRLLFSEAKLLVKKKNADTILISYRVFPVNLSKPVQHKDASLILPDRKGMYNPFTLNYTPSDSDPFKTEGLNKNGSIARGIGFGNNQNVVVNSNLNLQLSGKLTEEIEVLAAIADDNIPFQPEGNSQQLQEFDKVYIQLNDKRSKLVAGDFQLSKPEGYFMNYYKRSQGGQLSTTFSDTYRGNTKFKNTVSTAAAVSKGKFARNIIQGVEGNQGPYRLKGDENQSFIIVLSGTEKVYIDGQLLTRGQENEYVIDYNTAEVTFTPKRLITKDRRIVVEFQYSDKNYARALLQLSDEWKTDNLQLYLNLYSEQDSKNKPLQQKLDDKDKQVLRDIGDDLTNAIVSGVDSVGYRSDLVLYAKRDSIVEGYSYTVYYYSNKADSAMYQLSFSNVGQGNGDYVQETTPTNGRVFKWVSPLGGIRQGLYEPVVLLITPKKRQMISAGGVWKVDNRSNVIFETAVSNYDKNTFSSIDSKDDADLATRFKGDRWFNLSTDTSSWKLRAALNYEQVNKNFTAIERFRSVEFDRDWNIRNRVQKSHQFIAGSELGLFKTNSGGVNYLFNTFFEPGYFKGLQHKLITAARNNTWNVNMTSSATNTVSETNQTSFYRQKGLISKQIKVVTVGFKMDMEQNKFLNRGGDTLQSNSYQFNEMTLILSNSDTTGNRFSVNYNQRYDWAARANALTKSTFAQGAGFTSEIVKWKNSSLKTTTGYRRLTILDSSITSVKADNTLLNRIEYSLRALKGFISTNTFYETGAGLELKKEYAFVQVAAGQGNYAWRDYNENGIRELNEFELTNFTDQAQYIKVFTPTNQYIKAYSNQFSQSLNVSPSVLFDQPKGFKKFVSLWSNQTALRLDRKTVNNNLNEAYNPFYRTISDSALQSVNSTFRNTLFFNKTGFLFGADYTWQDVNGKTLLVNGFDARRNYGHTIRVRYNISKQFTLNGESNIGIKESSSQLLSTRNYKINYNEHEPRISYQSSPAFRTVLSYKYSEKTNNTILDDSTRTYQNKITTEIKFNRVGKGSWQGKVSYILLNYHGQVNSPIGYEMLDGLLPGRNITWNVNYQQNLANNMQISINYDGRQTSDGRVIHTGNVSVRAVF